jgi:hypothetical protein
MNPVMRLSSAPATGSGVRCGDGRRGWPRAVRVTRVVRTVVVGLLSVLLLGGCFGSGTKPATLSKTQQDQLVQRIKAQVAVQPNVTRASANYTRQAVLQPAELSVGVAVKPGQDFAPIIDAVTRIVWTSSLTPLSCLGIRILHEGAQDAQMVIVDLEGPNADKALVAKYGPRPRPGVTPAS